MIRSGDYRGEDVTPPWHLRRAKAAMSAGDMLEVLTVEEAADLLRISRNTAYTLARLWRETGGQDGLPVIELGRNLRVPLVGIQRLLEGTTGTIER